MAEVWFNKLDELKEQNLFKDLKKDLTNRTIVGEYVNSITHQHMVKYNRVTMMFYAVVDNYGFEEICWPCDKAINLFKKYNLDMVTMQSVGLYSDFESLCNGLEGLFRDIAKGTIRDDEEGSVAYIVKRDKDSVEKDTVLSLAKLKTIEYRLFRKMREKLRGYYRNQGKAQPDRLVAAFKRESDDFLEGNELPQPIEFYVQIMKSAFDFIRTYPEQLDILNSEYITFQENLLNYMAKKDQLDNATIGMFDS